jgi:hypothetical protein
MAQGFWRWARRDDGAYLRRSVTEEQRSSASKEQARALTLFRNGPLGLGLLAHKQLLNLSVQFQNNPVRLNLNDANAQDAVTLADRVAVD